MACNALTTIAKDCLTNIGGLKSFYVFDMDDLVTLTQSEATQLVTAMDITPDAGTTPTPPTSFYLKKNISNYDEAEAHDFTTGSDTFTNTITIIFHRREAAKSRSLRVLGEGQRYLGVVLEDANGVFWYCPDAQVSAIAGGSGTARADGSNYTVTLVAEYDSTMYAISEVDALAFISTGFFS